MSQPSAATPSKGRAAVPVDPGREKAARLNQIYNLGVPLPDGVMSPAAKEKLAQQDAHFRRHNSIVHNLRVLHYIDKDRLKAALDDFDAEAREQSANWTRKSRVRSAGPPRAHAVEDQVMLQELLLEALTRERDPAHDNMTQGTRVIGDAVASSSTSQNSVPEAASFASSAGSSVPQPASGNASAEAWEKSFWHERGRAKSASTHSSPGAPDSHEEPDETQPSTKTDTEDSREFPNALRRSISQDSFAISDTSLDALEETFNLFSDGANPDSFVSDAPGSPNGSDYSSIPEMADLQIVDCESDGAVPLPFAKVPGLEERLTLVFPSTPEWLRDAPFPIIWEMTRISLYFGVNLNDISMKYSPLWQNQGAFRKALSGHPSFARRPLPEQSSQLAWDVAFNQRASRGKPELSAVFTVTMEYNLSATGPLYLLKLHPITLDLPHRLSRYFGTDRFVELQFPSHNSALQLVPRILRNHEAAVREVNQWLAAQRHNFVGRSWAAFYAKDPGHKKTAASQDTLPGDSSSTIQLKRVYLFCEDGFGLTPAENRSIDGDNDWQPGTALQVYDMLDWLLQYNKFVENRTQPYLKLFSRIALGLSRTIPTIVFDHHQLRHHASDITSQATGKVMNDGIGRISLSVARKLRFELGLSDLPTAIQGRLGCAKGMWILDPTDTGCEDWIETYPSQRKWRCDFGHADHRTLEVRNYASEVRSAGLNQQLLPVLEDRALDRVRMHSVIGGVLKGNLCRDLESQKTALEHPLLFSAWVRENSRFRGERAAHCQVRFLGGLPDSDEEVIQFLVNGGFDPRIQKMVWDRAYKMQRDKCEKLKEKLNVRVGRTAYLHMVVDFLGVLEEGEVQVCFSSKFQVDADSEPDENGDDGSFSDSLIVGRDVLVARSPAHFASDIQRVRAVFRKELSMLKDVVIFSSKGDGPLADKLSGGDYDGDMAWVCWDPRIVENFVNAPAPEKYDLVELGYMRKTKTTLNSLLGEAGALTESAVSANVLDEMIERSFEFNMKESLLGKLTVYKEELCYWRGTISDKTGVILSTLLSELVDQAKQGTEFEPSDFNRLRKERLRAAKGKGAPNQRLAKPAYKGSYWPKGREVTDFIDYLKFFVAKPIIDRELKALDAFGKSVNDGNGFVYWDADLARPAKEFEELARTSDTCRAILDGLKSDIQEVRQAWDAGIRKWKQGSSSNRSKGENVEDEGYRQRVLDVYEQWCNISVRLPESSGQFTAEEQAQQAQQAGGVGKGGKKKGGGPAGGHDKVRLAALQAEEEAVSAILQQEYLANGEQSQWAQLRASQAFRMFHRQSEFVWRMAGRQLQAIKASLTYDGSGVLVSNGGDGTRCSNVTMTALHYAASRPDSKTIRQMVARLRGMEEDAMEFKCESFADDV